MQPSIRVSDEPRADAVRYEDPRAERHVRRFLRRPTRPPQVMLADGSIAPQSPVRSYAPHLGAGERTVFIDCANEAETVTCSVAEINEWMHWQTAETFEVDGRWFTFERGFWRGGKALMEERKDRNGDSTAILPAVGSQEGRSSAGPVCATGATRTVRPVRIGREL